VEFRVLEGLLIHYYCNPSVPLINHSGNGQICHLRLLGERSAGEAGDNLGLLERDVRAVAAT
jgi:hypothetical protein